MILEVEYYKGNVFLFGKNRSQSEIKRQLAETEQDCDKNEDNFISLFCLRYDWTAFDPLNKKTEKTDYVYDRDIKKLYRVNF